ncbi:MAG TPA: phytoene/squalene synthase family protein [Bauldia sp.]|nr:phytoene/squalene synthase family protein [Bauldia sp.]
MSDAPSHIIDIVRAADPDRYLSDLFAPADARPHLFALHAFAVEVAGIRGKVSEPTLGEMRLRWWETAIRGEHGGSPVAAALAGTIARFDLPLVAFDNLLRARVFDLYDDPIPTVNDLEGYAGDTESALMQLGAIILAGGKDPGTAELSGNAGVARSIVAVLRSLPLGSAIGQSFLPAGLLAKHNAEATDIAERNATPAVRAALADLKALARQRLSDARQLVSATDPALLPAFLPTAMVEVYLKRTERPGFDPLRDITDVSPLTRQWTLWRAARRGRI